MVRKKKVVDLTIDDLRDIIKDVIREIIRDEGVQPATLAILDGKIQIGLDPEILDAFAKFRNVEKVSSANLDSTIFSNPLTSSRVIASAGQ